MSEAAIGDITVAAFFVVVVFFVIGLLATACFGWESFKMAMVGKAYIRTFKVILVVFAIGFAGLVCWYEITVPPQERERRP